MTGETFAAMLKRLRTSQAGHTQGNGVVTTQPVLSQTALAHKAGIDPAYVNRLEHGGQTPSRTVVLALAEVLDISQAQTDRLLFAAGLAPQEDWQTRAVKAEVRLATIREALAEDDEQPTFIRRQVG